jgi:hypothetical protein
MACMTHECVNLKCGHIVFNNSSGPRTCPLCSSRMISSYDENEHGEDDFMEYDDIDRANEYKE